MTLEAELEKLMQPRLAAAWEAGLWAGEQYGQARERCPPDDWYNEPSKPQNPYRAPEHRG